VKNVKSPQVVVAEHVDRKVSQSVLPLFYVSCVGLYRPTHGPQTMGLYKKESFRESKIVDINEDECNTSVE